MLEAARRGRRGSNAALNLPLQTAPEIIMRNYFNAFQRCTLRLFWSCFNVYVSLNSTVASFESRRKNIGFDQTYEIIFIIFFIDINKKFYYSI